MVYGNTTDRAPRDVRALKAVDEAHDIVRASGGLPIIETLRSHGQDTAMVDPAMRVFWGKVMKRIQPRSSGKAELVLNLPPWQLWQPDNPAFGR
jgi:hypothetical protein